MDHGDEGPQAVDKFHRTQPPFAVLSTKFKQISPTDSVMVLTRKIIFPRK